MYKLLQINVSANWGSTGKIAEQIGLHIMQQGWESYIAYGRYSNYSKSHLIKIGKTADVYKHFLESKIFDNEGFASRRATKSLVNAIKKIQPNIIQIHNIHDHYLNYPILFKYLNTLNIPIIWTQHDCWAYTGGCTYYNIKGCYCWQYGCNNCPRRKGFYFDKSSIHYNLKKEIFGSLKNLIIVSVSDWLSKEISLSFLSDKMIHTIPNGVDTNIFTPLSNSKIREKYNLGNNKILLGVASVWHERKGLDDYLKLAKYLKNNEKIVLVGLNNKQSKNLPSNVIPIPRTENVNELVALYNEAIVVLNLSYEETFGLTTVEGLSCGTPGIVYNCTASPELINEETGRIVESGDINGVYNAITELQSIGKENMTKACRQRAVDKYNKDVCFNSYVKLYKSLI